MIIVSASEPGPRRSSRRSNPRRIYWGELSYNSAESENERRLHCGRLLAHVAHGWSLHALRARLPDFYVPNLICLRHRHSECVHLRVIRAQPTMDKEVSLPHGYYLIVFSIHHRSLNGLLIALPDAKHHIIAWPNKTDLGIGLEAPEGIPPGVDRAQTNSEHFRCDDWRV
jgi:hypothetical protein